MSNAERIKAILKQKNITLKEFNDRTGLGINTLNTAVKRKSDLTMDVLYKVFETFPEWDKNYILFGDQSHIYVNPNKYKPLKEIHEDPEGRSIPFVDGEFFATISPAMQDVITLKRDTFVKIPMFSSGEYAIQVTGNSMKGYINNGDFIIIRKLERLDKIIYGEVYVVVSKYDNHRTIKFVKEDQDKPDHLWLIPYNVDQFEPQLIEKEDILEIYLVIGSFRKIGN